MQKGEKRQSKVQGVERGINGRTDTVSIRIFNRLRTFRLVAGERLVFTEEIIGKFSDYYDEPGPVKWDEVFEKARRQALAILKEKRPPRNQR